MSRIDTHISNSQITARDSALQWRPLESQFLARQRLSDAMQRPDINEWWAQLTDMQRFGYAALVFGGSVGIVCGLVALSHANPTNQNSTHEPDLGDHGRSFITPETAGAVFKATVLLLSTGGDVSHIKILPMSEAGKSVDNKVFCLPPNGHSLVENTCVKSEISLVVDSQDPQKLSKQIISAWPVVESVLPASAEGDKGTSVSVIITKDGSQFLLTTSPIKTKDGKSYFLAKAWATPIDQDPSWEAEAVADGNHDLWLQIPLFQAKFDADLAQRRLSVPPGLKEQVLRFPVKGKINGIWIFDSKRTAQIVSSNGNKREQIAGMAPFTDLAFSLGRVRLAGDGANVAPATPTTPPTEAPTLVPATEVPAQFKPAEEYINDPNGQWVDFGPNVLRWQKQPKIPIAFGGTNYEFGSAAGVVFKDMITDKDGLQRALFGFKRGNDSFLFTVLVDPVTCVDDRGYPPTGFDLLKTENRVNIYLFFKGSPKPAIEIGKACAFVNDLKVAQINYISSYFVGQKHDQAGKILDLSDQLVLADVR